MQLRRSLAFLLPGFAALLLAQRPVPVLTTADYAHAEQYMAYNTTPLVFRSGVRPTWMAGDRFWYRVTTTDGSEFVLIDPAKATREPAFDQTAVAAALSKAAGTTYDGSHLPFQQIDISEDLKNVMFNLGSRRYSCDRLGTMCAATGNAEGGGGGGRGGRGGGGRGGGIRNEVPSPDKKKVAFIRDYNIWVRDAATRKETQLTKDGVKDYGYATDNAGWQKSERPILVWSPDSTKIATFQQDQRKVGEMYLVETRVGHPVLQTWKYPLPGDDIVAMIEPVILDVVTGKMVRVKLPPQQHRSTLCDDIACRGGEWSDVQWEPTGFHLAMVNTSRDHKQEQFRIVETETGAVTEIFDESVPTFFESGNGKVNWQYLPGSKEILWFSERDNWGHLYLYDAATGKVKNAINQGEGNVTQVLHVDEKNRVIFFLGVGMEKGRDPYFIHFYRINFDGKGLKLLTPEDANHDVMLSPDAHYFVDSYSKPDVPPVAVVRDDTGKLISTLEKADISKLLATGWKPPIPFTVKARDGKTDLYGLMFQPTKFDPARKYPIINHIYPGPQTGSVGSRSFSAARGDCQSLAELGFVVMELDGMGTPWRSKKFHEAYFGDMGDNTLPDQVTGMKQLAQRYPYIDIDRAGIYGHSGGGYATAGAMFHYPDFFKVGISESGNHDNREYEDDWAEKWQGLLEKQPDGKTNYDSQANQNFAKNLKGHLLLAHGTMDTNVPPYNTLLVVDALIKANKDFDLLMLPNRAHGYGEYSDYMTRRRWDYFVRYLMGGQPPEGYELHSAR
jgi:dipeptidyl aminopeptidase/acylaminoacyl peptidase